MVERLYRVEDAAKEILGVGRTVVYDKIARGEIRSVVIGRLRRIPESALTEYIEKLKRDQAAGTEG
ncbi:MAG TPA: helix-turn-helix domain-containing protein [Fimbriimonadaceae bacterium]|nr:helix-turn-helix domain-containing protein [Fimbriimonadaceae bacterium]